MPLKARLREAASDAILDALEEVAVERGYDATSIAAIAERAGVAVGTLYNYFPDREAMFAALFRARRADIAPRIAAAAVAAKGLPFEKRLRSYIRALSAAFDDKRQFMRLAILMDQQGRRITEPTLMKNFEEDILDILRDAAAANELPTPRLDEYAQLLVGSLRAFKHWQVAHDQPFDADFIVDTFLYGVKSKKR